MKIKRKSVLLAFSLLLTIFFLFLFLEIQPACAVRAPVGAEWLYGVRGRAYSSPMADNAMVYVGSDEGKLYVLKGSTGVLKWSHDTEQKVRCCPLVHKGVVYLSLNNGNLFALNAFSGEPIWAYDVATEEHLPTQVGYFFVSSPVVLDDLVVHSALDGKIIAFDTENGRVIWIYNTGTSFASPPGSGENLVYFSSIDGELHAVNLNGKLEWSYEGMFGCDYAPAVTDEMVFHGSEDGNIYALDARSGDTVWKRGGLEIAKGIMAVKDLVYFTSHNGNLYALDSKDGSLRWRFDTEGPYLSLPRVFNGVLYLGSSDGRLYALDAKTGDLNWVYDTEGYFVTSVAAEGKMLYVGASLRRGPSWFINLIGFKKGSYLGTRIWVRSGKQDLFSTKLMDYLTGTARGTLRASVSDEAFRMVFYPFGLPLNGVEEVAGKIGSLGLLRGYVKDFMPSLATCCFLFSLVLSSQIVGASFSFILLFGGLLVLVAGLYPLEKVPFLAGTIAEGEKRKVLKKTLVLTLKNYPLIFVNLVIIGFCLLFSWAASEYHYDVRTVALLFLVVPVGWILVILVGSLIRCWCLSLIVQEGERFWSRLRGAIARTGKHFPRLVAVSVCHIFLVCLASFLLGFGKLTNSYLLIIPAFLASLLLVLISFADACVVFRGSGVFKSLYLSAIFCLRNFHRVVVYVFFLGVVLLFCSYLPLVLSGFPFGGPIALAVMVSVLSVPLTHLHGAFFIGLSSVKKEEKKG